MDVIYLFIDRELSSCVLVFIVICVTNFDLYFEIVFEVMSVNIQLDFLRLLIQTYIVY